MSTKRRCPHASNVCQSSNPDVAMSMMTSQILKSVNFTQTRTSRYLRDKILFFLHIKKLINYTSMATLLQKIVS